MSGWQIELVEVIEGKVKISRKCSIFEPFGIQGDCFGLVEYTTLPRMTGFGQEVAKL